MDFLSPTERIHFTQIHHFSVEKKIKTFAVSWQLLTGNKLEDWGILEDQLDGRFNRRSGVDWRQKNNVSLDRQSSKDFDRSEIKLDAN